MTPLWWMGVAHGHAGAPVVFHLSVEGQTVTLVRRRSDEVPVAPTAEPGPGCALRSLTIGAEATGAERQTTVWWCEDPGTARLTLSDLGGGAAIVRHGEAGSWVWMTAADASTPVVSESSDAGGWVAQGVHHLVGGLDHVLLVVLLTAALGRTRGLALGLLGFTVGHALTLFLLVAGWVAPPAALVEVGIAASLWGGGLWLLAALDRGAAEVSVTRAAGSAVVVGLVHGLGFGGALQALGLPQGRLLPALVSFHVGLEIAQVGVCFVTLSALGALGGGVGTRRAVAWGVGTVGAGWTLTRALSGL